MTILTYYTYRDVLSSKNTVYYPINSLERNAVCSIIKSKLETLIPDELINYCSFLNMVCQTEAPETIIKLSLSELKHTGINIRIKTNALLFHRDNLLYAIADAIMNNHSGAIQCTGEKNETGSKKLYEILLLTNSLLNFQKIEETLYLLLLRGYPQYYDLHLTSDHYNRWLKRYRYIYDSLLTELDKKKDMVEKGIKLLEKEMNVTLKEYFTVIRILFSWYIFVPFLSSKQKGFNHQDPNTFYIDKNNFSGKNPLLKLILKMALNLTDMKKFIQKACDEDTQKNRSFDPFFQRLMKLFHRPVFRTNDSIFCIVDFKFLIEGVCSGLIWRLQPLLEQENQSQTLMQNLRSQYGYLLELYFLKLLNKIFGQINKEEETGQPDAIIRWNNNSLIFEFTVEYYQMSSLYSPTLEKAHADIDKLLFNKKNTKKKQPGKFINIDNSVKNEKSKNPNSVIIPILVTEKYIGDYELLQKAGFNLNEQIANLTHLTNNRPLIIGLDELEMFWACASENHDEAIQEFIICINAWYKEDNKGIYGYNFGRFLLKYFEHKEQRNENYSKFFDPTSGLDTVN